MANKLARHNKPFSEAEFIKDCISDAVSIICPEVKTKVEALSMSRRTVVHHIESIAVNVQEQLSKAITDCQWFSIALDESADLQDTAQLLIYIRI